MGRRWRRPPPSLAPARLPSCDTYPGRKPRLTCVPSLRFWAYRDRLWTLVNQTFLERACWGLWQQLIPALRLRTSPPLGR